jgi:hypothetical protein
MALFPIMSCRNNNQKQEIGKTNNLLERETNSRNIEMSNELKIVELTAERLDTYDRLDFGEYLIYDNNMVKNKKTLTPFTGKVIIHYNGNFPGTTDLNCKDGFIDTETRIWYASDEFIRDKTIWKYIYSVGEKGNLEIMLSMLENYVYSQTTGKIYESKIADLYNGFPSRIYKKIIYDIDGEKDSEGYIVSTNSPMLEPDNNIGFLYQEAKIGRWIYYSNGEIIRERVFGLVNKQIDFETYNFNEHGW